MAKRFTPELLLELLKSFKSGSTIDELSTKYKCTKLTISRNLKKNIGEKKYKEILLSTKSLSLKTSKKSKKINETHSINESRTIDEKSNVSNEKDLQNKESFSSVTFMEIPPMDFQIEALPQKDLTSVPISDVDFPKIVYMIVDKKIELEIKLLKDYPEWHFLPEEDLQIKTIEIYFDLKRAKRDCKKDQKVIKVPNPNVFIIASKIMVSRGISRIICDKQLISL